MLPTILLTALIIIIHTTAILATTLTLVHSHPAITVRMYLPPPIIITLTLTLTTTTLNATLTLVHLHPATLARALLFATVWMYLPHTEPLPTTCMPSFIMARKETRTTTTPIATPRMQHTAQTDPLAHAHHGPDGRVQHDGHYAVHHIMHDNTDSGSSRGWTILSYPLFI
jgi:hypothetical protein